MKMLRRSFLKQALVFCAAAKAATFAATGVFARPGKQYKRIAVEEGFSIPELFAEMSKFLKTGAKEEPGLTAMYGDVDRATTEKWGQRLTDLGESRIKAMDASGISKQVLVLSSPGVQVFEEDRATAMAKLVNDRLAEAVCAYPDRFAGLATVAPQDPSAAALELERGVKKLGLKGGLINSHTKGEYLDNKKFWPILDAAQALNVPIYIHPRTPSPRMIEPYLEYALEGSIWGYAAETSLHALRLIFSGVFDEFPGLKIVLGHMGEGIPFFLFRIDTRYKVQQVISTSGRMPTLKRNPSEYFKDNFVITTSGMNWHPALMLSYSVLGADNIMFAADYPFEIMERAVSAMDGAPLPAGDMEKIYYLNAERVFGL